MPRIPEGGSVPRRGKLHSDALLQRGERVREGGPGVPAAEKSAPGGAWDPASGEHDGALLQHHEPLERSDEKRRGPEAAGAAGRPGADPGDSPRCQGSACARGHGPQRLSPDGGGRQRKERDDPVLPGLDGPQRNVRGQDRLPSVGGTVPASALEEADAAAPGPGGGGRACAAYPDPDGAGGDGRERRDLPEGDASDPAPGAAPETPGPPDPGECTVA